MLYEYQSKKVTANPDYSIPVMNKQQLFSKISIFA